MCELHDTTVNHGDGPLQAITAGLMTMTVVLALSQPDNLVSSSMLGKASRRPRWWGQGAFKAPDL